MPVQAPGGGPSAARQPEGERSHYLQWIQRDLSYWRQRGGITQQLVDAAEAQMTCCYFRAQVVGGRLYITHPPPDPKKGFFPAGLGPGWASAKGRIHYAVLALMDTLRHYPGVKGRESHACHAVPAGWAVPFIQQDMH